MDKYKSCKCMEHRNGMEGGRMTREEAAQILDGLHELLDIEDGKDWRVAVDALLLASAALREQAHEWVRTADRVPTEADAGVDEEILTIYDDGEKRLMGMDYWAFVAKVPERFPYWLPVPKLPEVDDD